LVLQPCLINKINQKFASELLDPSECTALLGPIGSQNGNARTAAPGNDINSHLRGKSTCSSIEDAAMNGDSTTVTRDYPVSTEAK